MNAALVANAGSLLSVESGEYSDYGVIGFFVVLRDFTPADQLSKYLDEFPKSKRPHCFESDEFLAFLLKDGFLLEVLYGTLHLENYGRASEFSFRPAVRDIIPSSAAPSSPQPSGE